MIHALMNHLWQSTLFAVAAGLLTLILRKNGSYTRYWVWCAASYKFLIPFSLLTTAGNYLSWRSAPATSVPPMLDQFVQPFSLNAVVMPIIPSNAMPNAAPNPVWIWMAIWACGTFAVAIHWMVRWLRIRAVLRSATPLSLPPLLTNPLIRVRSSRMLIEPGVVGFFRPVLLLPDGISERLTPQQLQMIVTHEMCHVRRRDNLTAAIHMLVEAIFWFHPLVWWLGRRMIVEREAVCDEAVIASGGDREVYAEALLTVCKFYVESPLPSAAGVSGADLKKRIFRIMAGRAALKLNFSRKLLLSVAGFVAVAVPIVFGLANATQIAAESQPENTAVAGSVAAGPANPTHNRGESPAESNAATRAGDIGNYIEALGTVTPVNTVSVTSRVEGQIMDVRYTEGQMVHKGDPLVDIDPRPYQATLTQMEGQLARDQAVLATAISKQQADDQSQAVQQDKAMVQNDEGQVRNAQLNLEYCHITSPIEGRVGLRLMDTGNLVQANGTNPLVVITQLQPITVVFNVAEDRLPQIERQLRLGQRLAVDVFDRTQTKKFASGYLLAADNQIDAATGTVKLRAVFPNTDSSLFPNQFVNVRMEKSVAVQAAQAQSIPTNAAAPPPVFEVASIKPDHSGTNIVPTGKSDPSRFVANSTVKMLIDFAFNLRDFQVSGGPSWIGTERFSIDAKVEDSIAERLQNLPRAEQIEQMRLMVQSLLADRFKLSMSRQTKDLPTFALTIAKGGPKLIESIAPPSTFQGNSPLPTGRDSGPPTPPPGAVIMGMGLGGQVTLTGKSAPLASLVNMLSQQFNRPILDQTGLKSTYDFVLHWTSETGLGGRPPLPVAMGSADVAASETSGTSIFTAIQDQLGLKLESTKGPLDTIVIDHVEKPSEN